jgi:hypothetical protein
MASKNERAALKRLLGGFDRLDAHLASASAVDSTTGFRAAAKTRALWAVELKRSLAELPADSRFGAVVRRYRLDSNRVAVLLALVRQRINAADPFISGRRLLTLLFDSSYDLLRGSGLLSDGDVLSASGLVQREPGDGNLEIAPLDARYRISDSFVRMLQEAVEDLPRIPNPEARLTPYRTNLAYLIDLRGLSLLYRSRASAVFQLDYFADVGSGPPRNLSNIRGRIAAATQRISLRLETSTRNESFPLVSASTEYRLRFDELVVLVTLLFQELREGAAFLDCVDILKLVSESEEDLVRKRRFLSKRSPLIRHNLIAIENVVGDKELTGEAYLPNWVVDRRRREGRDRR